MKVCYIALKGMPLGGGIERYTEEVGSRLAARGHEVTAYCMPFYGARPGVHRGIRVRVVPAIDARSLQKITAALMATLDQIRRDFDLVHYHAIGSSVFAFVPRLLGRRTVVQIHGLEWKRSRWGPVARAFFRVADLSVLLPHRVTAVSRVLKEHFERRFRREVVYIPTGVNPPVRRAPRLIRRFGLEGGDYVLFASRLVPEKGAHLLIEAFRGVRGDLKLVIAGDAQHEERYKRRLRRLAAGDPRVVFTGFAQGELLEELFTNALLFCQPSEIEGLPTALLEAMSYGLPALASDIPENLEALGGHGFSFRCGDADDLRERLRELLADREALRRAGREASRYVLERYSWDGIAERMERLYLETMEEG